MSSDLPHFHSKDERYRYTDTLERSFVLLPKRSAASIAIISDNPDLPKDFPNPAITIMGPMTDRAGHTIEPDMDGHSVLSLVFTDPNDALHLIAHLLTLILAEDNVKTAITAISALANIDQVPVFVEAANAAMDQLEDHLAEEEKK